MNIVIAGAGAVGTHLAKMLSRQEHNIMLIDTNQDKLEDLESQIDILSIVGSCTSIGALKDAEVGKCDLYIAVNPQEDQNINSAILAKKLGAKRTIARVNNSEYLEIENAEYLRSIGIDSLIYPERLAAEEIVASLKQIGSRQMHEFSDGRLQLLGIKLWDNALILNHTLIKMAEIYGRNYLWSRSVPDRCHQTPQPYHHPPGKRRIEIWRSGFYRHPTFFYSECFRLMW